MIASVNIAWLARSCHPYKLLQKVTHVNQARLLYDLRKQKKQHWHADTPAERPLPVRRTNQSPQDLVVQSTPSSHHCARSTRRIPGQDLCGEQNNAQ